MATDDECLTLGGGGGGGGGLLLKTVTVIVMYILKWEIYDG